MTPRRRGQAAAEAVEAEGAFMEVAAASMAEADSAVVEVFTAVVFAAAECEWAAAVDLSAQGRAFHVQLQGRPSEAAAGRTRTVVIEAAAHA